MWELRAFSIFNPDADFKPLFLLRTIQSEKIDSFLYGFYFYLIFIVTSNCVDTKIKMFNMSIVYFCCFDSWPWQIDC